MWAVAVTILFQSVIILIGLALVAVARRRHGGRRGQVIAAASDAGKFEFLPKGGAKEDSRSLPRG